MKANRRRTLSRIVSSKSPCKKTYRICIQTNKQTNSCVHCHVHYRTYHIVTNCVIGTCFYVGIIPWLYHLEDTSSIIISSSDVHIQTITYLIQQCVRLLGCRTCVFAASNPVHIYESNPFIMLQLLAVCHGYHGVCHRFVNLHTCPLPPHELIVFSRLLFLHICKYLTCRHVCYQHTFYLTSWKRYFTHVIYETFAVKMWCV